MEYPPTKDKSFPLYGGLDLVNSMMSKSPGSLVAGKNIQIISGQNGYSRLGGVERCTDDTFASNSTPIYLLVADNTATISTGDIGTSGDVTVICLSGITGGGEQVVPVVCSDQDNDLSAVTDLTFAGGSIAIDSLVLPEAHFTNTEVGRIRSLAKDYFLTFIPEVPGTGSNSGGFRLRGENYVFRNGALFKGESLEWTTVDMPDVMYFNSGVSSLSVGDVVTDGAETATIASITKQTGSYNHTYGAIDQAAGYLTLSGVSGDFSIGSDLVVVGAAVPAVGSFTDDGVSTYSQSYSLSAGDVVELTISLSGVSAGTITPALSDGEGLPDEGSVLTSSGTHTVLVAATKDITSLQMIYDSDFDGTIVSVTASVGRRAKVATVNETYVLPVGGNYEVEINNFTNISGNDSAFGCSGVGHAFEFDGTNYIPIYHPDTEKFPNHLMIHQERLHLCFPGGEKPYSVSGEPRVFDSMLGSGSHSTGSEITGCVSISGNSALILCARDRWFLTGDGVYDDASATRNWSFFNSVAGEGGEGFTLVGGDITLFASGGSVYQLTATDTTAGYSFNDVSEMFAPSLVDKIGKATCSVWIESKSQYRLFFEDGLGLYISFRGGSVMGATSVELPMSISNIWKSIEGSTEFVFFTADNTDYLYRMDSGDSMDGDYIKGSFRIPFHSYGYSRHEKEFPQIVVELSAPVLISNDTTIQFAVNFDYGSSKSPIPSVQTATDIEGAGAIYGENSGFGNFVWSGAVVTEIFAYIDGYGANMSLLVAFETKNDLAFAFQSVSVDYIVHGRKGRG